MPPERPITPSPESPYRSDVHQSAEDSILDTKANVLQILQEGNDDQRHAQLIRNGADSNPGRDDESSGNVLADEKTQNITRATNHVDERQDTSMEAKDCRLISDERHLHIQCFCADANECTVAF